MKHPLLLFPLLLAGAFALEAQSVVPVYPVRKGHKWGYISFWQGKNGLEADTAISPKYDALSDLNAGLPYNTYSSGRRQNSPFRLFERDGRLGVIDKYFNEVLSNKYKRIRPLTPLYFAVEIDSLFTVVDTSGRVVLQNAHYNDIFPLQPSNAGETDYFLVKKGKKLGIHRKNGGLLVPPKYEQLEPAGHPDYFKVKEDSLYKYWRLVNAKGELAAKDEFQDVLVLSEQLIAVKPKPVFDKNGVPDESSYYWRMLGFNQLRTYPELRELEGFMPVLTKSEIKVPTLGGLYKSVQKLNAQLAVLELKEKAGIDELFDIQEQRSVNDTLHIEPLDENYVIGRGNLNNRGWRYTAILGKGGAAVMPLQRYETISPSGIPHVFRVRRSGLWGLLTVQDSCRLILPCRYTSIDSFRFNIAICHWGNISTALRYDGNSLDTLRNLHQQLSFTDAGGLLAEDQRAEGTIVTYTLYKVDEQGKFQVEKHWDNTRKDNLSKNTPWFVESGDKDLLIVVTDTFENRAIRRVPGLNAFSMRDSAVQLKRGQDAWLRLLDKQGGLADPRHFAGAVRFGDADSKLFTLYQTEGAVLLSGISSDTFCRMSVYDFYQKRFIHPPDLLGFRNFQEEYPYTAFIAADGKMGLIDRKGQQKNDSRGQALRFTYIGPFVAGRARVCTGGELLGNNDEGKIIQPGALRIASETEFIYDFSLYEPRLAQTETPVLKVDRYVMVKYIYAVPAADTALPPKWGYIDRNGNYLVQPDFDFARNYNPSDSTAFVINRNARAFDDVNSVDYGVLDFQGKLLLPVQYSFIKNFKDYFFVSVDSQPVLHFNNRGHQLIANRTKPRDFAEGFYCFKEDSTGKWGYIDTLGEKVIPARFDAAFSFSEGLAAVADSSGYFVFINKKGETVFSTGVPKNAPGRVGKFSAGRCKIKKEKNWSYLNRQGQDIMPDAFVSAGDFTTDGAAIVRVYEGGRVEYAVIDTLGQYMLKPGSVEEFDTLVFDTYSMARFKDKSGKWGLINTTGEEVLKAVYKQRIKAFEDGYAQVSNDGRLWGLMDTAGREVLPLKYARIGAVSEGMAAVKVYGSNTWQFWDIRKGKNVGGGYLKVEPFKNGYTLVNGSTVIDRSGQVIFQRNGGIFSEGIFGFPKNGPNNSKRYYYSDASGDNLFLSDFAAIEPFVAGLAKVRLPGKPLLGAINARGIVIVPPKYRRIQQVGSNIELNPNRVYGLIDKKGKKSIAEPLYDRITQYPNGVLRFEFGEKIGYGRITPEGVDWLWPLQY